MKFPLHLKKFGAKKHGTPNRLASGFPIGNDQVWMILGRLSEPPSPQQGNPRAPMADIKCVKARARDALLTTRFAQCLGKENTTCPARLGSCPQVVHLLLCHVKCSLCVGLLIGLGATKPCVWAKKTCFRVQYLNTCFVRPELAK